MTNKHEHLPVTSTTVLTPAEIRALGKELTEEKLQLYNQLSQLLQTTGDTVDVTTDGERYLSGKWRVSQAAVKRRANFDDTAGAAFDGSYTLAQAVGKRANGGRKNLHAIHLIVDGNYSSPFATLDPLRDPENWYQQIGSTYSDTKVDGVALSVLNNVTQQLTSEMTRMAYALDYKRQKLKKRIALVATGLGTIAAGVTAALVVQYQNHQAAEAEQAAAEAFDEDWDKAILSGSILVDGEVIQIEEIDLPDGIPKLKVSNPNSDDKRTLKGYGMTGVDDTTLQQDIVRTFIGPESDCATYSLDTTVLDTVTVATNPVEGAIVAGLDTETRTLQICTIPFNGNDKIVRPEIAIQITSEERPS